MQGRRVVGPDVRTTPKTAGGPHAAQSVIVDYGSLDAPTREAIALAVGNADDCSYCQAAHTGGGKAAGLTDDEMLAIRRGTVDFDPKLAALLTLAREYTKGVGSVQDATWQSALDTGWTEEQLAELSVHVTLNLFTNYFNHFVQTELDLPAHLRCDPPSHVAATSGFHSGSGEGSPSVAPGRCRCGSQADRAARWGLLVSLAHARQPRNWFRYV